MEIFTIGFAATPAETFFDSLVRSGVEHVLDVRLRNTSQIAGYTQQRDFPYFLARLVGATYEHERLLAPTPELLDAYRSKKIDWDAYSQGYLGLLIARSAADAVPRFSKRTALLCSEHSPDKCHRRLAAEYLATRWGDVQVRHL